MVTCVSHTWRQSLIHMVVDKRSRSGLAIQVTVFTTLKNLPYKH